MSRLDGLLHRLRVLVRGERYAREQTREVEFHLELEAMAHSSAPDTDALRAETAARRRFGNVTYYREEARRVSALGLVDRLQQDVRYALRGLRRQPGFTAMVVVTLALGFGVNAAMFSLLNRLFVHQPDGVVKPEEVRRFYNDVHQETGLAGGRTVVFDRYEYPHFRAMVEAGAGRELALATAPESILMRIGTRASVEHTSRVSSAYFNVLGVKPERGRFFVAEEDSVQTPTPVAVISDYLWHSAFGGRPTAVGERVLIDQKPYVIIGVAHENFRGIDVAVTDVWLPLNTHAADDYSGTGAPWYESFSISARLIARIQTPGSEARLVAIVQRAVRTVRIKHFQFDPDETVRTGSLIANRGPMPRARETEVLTRIAAVAGFVLLIAIANVINLLLLRASNRSREIALRRALGVSTRRLIWQLIVESTLLSLLAGTVAIGVGAWFGAALRTLVMPATHWAAAPVDLPTAAFVLCLSLLIGLLTAIAPAMRGAHASVADCLKAGRLEGTYRSTIRTGLTVVQAALCTVLLVGAGLFTKSLINMKSVDTGYDVDDVVMAGPTFPARTGRHAAELRRALPELVERLSAQPSVAVVSFASAGPMQGMRFISAYLPNGQALLGVPSELSPAMNFVSPTFFDATGMRLLRGRVFAAADGPNAPRVAIVNATMARTVWPGESPLGKCLIIRQPKAACTTVVGVVSDANRMAVIEPRSMFFYLPAAQGDSTSPASTLIVRAQSGQVDRVNTLVQKALTNAFPGAEGIWSRTLHGAVEREARPWSIGAGLFTVFGVLAFIVAGVGVYSVVAYAVSQRTHELGIRIALGATRVQIADLVVGSGLRSVAVGIALGLIAAFLLAPLVRSLMFGVTVDDPSTYIGAATALCLLGGVASLIPALRASRVDPVVALRSE